MEWNECSEKNSFCGGIERAMLWQDTGFWGKVLVTQM